MTKSTTLGEVLLAGADIMTDLNLAVKAEQEGNLLEIQEIIQTACDVE